MAISYVQIDKGDFLGASASTAVTFNSGTTAGSIIVVVAACDDVVTGITITNNNSDAVTDSGLGLVTFGTIFKVRCQAFLTPTTGTTTVTATFSGTNPTYGDLYIWEVAGLTSAVFDKFVSATGSGTAADSGTTGVLAAADEAAVAYGGSGGAFASPGTGWTTGQGTTVGTNTGDGINPNTGSIGEHRVTAATTAINGTATNSNSSWGMLCATLRSGAADTLLGQACL
jgi:hypothetical protein